jgi:hypothetical protein
MSITRWHESGLKKSHPGMAVFKKVLTQNLKSINPCNKFRPDASLFDLRHSS